MLQHNFFFFLMGYSKNEIKKFVISRDMIFSKIHSWVFTFIIFYSFGHKIEQIFIEIKWRSKRCYISSILKIISMLYSKYSYTVNICIYESE